MVIRQGQMYSVLADRETWIVRLRVHSTFYYSDSESLHLDGFCCRTRHGILNLLEIPYVVSFYVLSENYVHRPHSLMPNIAAMTEFPILTVFMSFHFSSCVARGWLFFASLQPTPPFSTLLFSAAAGCWWSRWPTMCAFSPRIYAFKWNFKFNFETFMERRLSLTETMSYVYLLRHITAHRGT